MVFLIGFMGCGKSTLGKKMADSMRLPFFDTDTLIEDAHNMSITQIMIRRDEDYFRNLESAILEKLPETGVCATGGGIVIRESNREFMKNHAHRIIFIDTPWNLIWQRIKDTDRPLLKDKTEEQIHQMWLDRLPLYRECANFTISSSETP